MTDTLIFRLLGIVYLAAGLGTLLKGEYYVKVTRDFAERPASLYMGSILAVGVGFLLVAFHNVWIFDWPVIVTLLGWIALGEGIVGLVIPDTVARLLLDLCGWPRFSFWAGVCAGLMGVLFLLLGFVYG